MKRLVLLFAALLVGGCGEKSSSEGSESASENPTVSNESAEPSESKPRVPGTPVRLTPPPGFEKATHFPGWMMESSESTIVVTDLAGAPFREVVKGFSKARAAEKGMLILSSQEMKVGTRQGLLLHVSQMARGTAYLKWMLTFGDEANTTLVVATFPKAVAEQFSDVLKNAVLSTEWAAMENADPFEGLTFTVEEVGDLRIATRIGNNVLLSRKGVYPDKSPGAPMITIGSSLSENWEVPGNKRAFARARLSQIDVLTRPKISSEELVTIDGISGYLIRAEGTDRDTAGNLYAEQCILFTDHGYYISQALVGAEHKAAYEPRFRKVLESFKQTPVENK